MQGFLWLSNRRSDGRQGGCLAGNAGVDGLEDAGGDGAAAWVWDCAAHRADERQPPVAELWDAVSGAAEDGTRGIDCGRMGRFGEQSPGKILPPDESGPETVGEGGTELGADYRDRCPVSFDGGSRMKRLRALIRRVAGLFSGTERERELSDEIESHLQMHIDDNLRAGMTSQEARRQAMLRLGGVEKTKQTYRERGTLPLVEDVLGDLRFALRQLVKHPGFAVTAIVVLALGIGVSVAIFGFVDAALLEPLPYASPGRLMSVNESSVESPRWPLSYLDYLDWQRLNKSFSSLDVYTGTGYILRSSSGAEPVQAERVSGGFFQTLGVRPMLGRDFYADENRPGGPDVLLLSYGAWLHRFGARADVLGQAVDLDGRAFTIIGVLPRTFSFAPAGNAEFWVPVNNFSTHEKMRIFYNFWGIGRLRDGVSTEAALGEMTAIAKRLQQEYGMTGRELTASVIPLSEILIGEVRPILLTLLGGAGLLLLIACVNVASLVLVRSESRRREIAVRGALGATAARLLQQFTTDGFVLVATGAALGLIAAHAAMSLLSSLISKDMISSMPYLQA